MKAVILLVPPLVAFYSPFWAFLLAYLLLAVRSYRHDLAVKRIVNTITKANAAHRRFTRS